MIGKKGLILAIHATIHLLLVLSITRIRGAPLHAQTGLDDDDLTVIAPRLNPTTTWNPNPACDMILLVNQWEYPKRTLVQSGQEGIRRQMTWEVPEFRAITPIQTIHWWVQRG